MKYLDENEDRQFVLIKLNEQYLIENLEPLENLK